MHLTNGHSMITTEASLVPGNEAKLRHSVKMLTGTKFQVSDREPPSIYDSELRVEMVRVFSALTCHTNNFLLLTLFQWLLSWLLHK